MSFTSISFIFFIVAVFFINYICQAFLKSINVINLVLLGSCLIFYSFSDIRFLPFLIYSIGVTYIFSFFVTKKRIIFLVAIILELLPLIFFKYLSLFISPFTEKSISLFVPLGLSFFTFQSLGYLIEIKRKNIEIERNVITLSCFISFFPVISSGPIQRAGIFIPQLKQKRLFDYELTTDGLKLFMWGIFKKVIIADSLNSYINQVYSKIDNVSPISVLFSVFLFSFQLYLDFSGYSDMAVGISNSLGFRVGKNFDHPYLSKSCKEFWKRWHISLSSWFQDYLYIPLGGNRVSNFRNYVNLMITFLISGLWHGASITFVIWGGIHGIYLCLGKIFNRVNKRLPDFIRIGCTFVLISFAWIFFKADDLNTGGGILKRLIEVPTEIKLFFSEYIRINGLFGAIKKIIAFECISGGTMELLMTSLNFMIFVIISLCTYNNNGVIMLREKNVVVRWLFYVIFVILIITNMPLNVSNNFAYFKF